MKNGPATIMLAAVALVVSTLLTIDAVNPSTATSRPSAMTAEQAVSGSWYCAAGDTLEGRTTDVVVAPLLADRPAPTDVVVSTFAGGTVERGTSTRILPEQTRVESVPPERDEVGVAARWWGTPAVLSRVWRVGGTGFPSGWVAGPCEPGPSGKWYIPGLSTSGGAQARLVLANPFGSDATALVSLATPEGPLQPARLENVVVPAWSIREIVLNEHVPEREDLGVIVHTLAGRTVVEAIQTYTAAIGGIDGVTLVKAARSPASQWSVPYVEVARFVGEEDEGDEDGVDSWLWVTNVAADPVEVSFTAHGPEGPRPPEGMELLTVPGGTVTRVDIADLLPGFVGRAGITVSSGQDASIVVSAGTVRRDPAAVLSALAVQLASPEPDPIWVFSVPPPTDRTTVVHLLNPGSSPAEVRLAVRVDDELVAEIGEVLTVEAGTSHEINITRQVSRAETLTVYVRATSGSVVAGYRSLSLTGRPDLVVGVGASGAPWAGGSLTPPVTYLPRMVQRLGTGADRRIPPAGEPAPTETAADDRPTAVD